LNLNQVMLAEEDRDGKGVANVRPLDVPFNPHGRNTKGTIMFRFGCFALAAFAMFAAPVNAGEKPTLTVYTYDSFAAEWGPGPLIKAGFEADCACTVDFATSEDAISTLRKLQLEGATTTADVVVGLDTTTMEEARGTGLFAPHGLILSGLSLPEAWTDPDFVPFDYGYFAFVYNTERLADPPRSFEELIAAPETLKIVIQDPRSSTPGLGLVSWIAAAYGERAPEVWAGLKPHILTVTRGWSEAYGLFLEGEADMVLSYTTSPAYHAVAENDGRFAYAPFREGFVQQVEVAGLVASTDQPRLARDFLAFLVSPAAQKIIPTTNWMYPVLDIGSDLPAAFGPPPQPVVEPDPDADSRALVDAALAAIR
jgi:thiamine transport system substrate-binding protein